MCVVVQVSNNRTRWQMTRTKITKNNIMIEDGDDEDDHDW